MNTDNIDRFGHCVACHKNLITKRVVDGKVVDMFLPEHGHTDFLLNNGSIMKVCMCRPCRESIDLKCSEVQSDIMEACMKGWELETKMLVADKAYPEWTEEHGEKYLERMSKLDIDCHSDDLSKNVLHERSKELSNSFMENK